MATGRVLHTWEDNHFNQDCTHTPLYKIGTYLELPPESTKANYE